MNTPPASALVHVCDAVARDPEPLLTLSQRARTLCELRSLDRSTRLQVDGSSLPALSAKFAPPSRRSRATSVPDMADIARMTDGSLRALASDLGLGGLQGRRLPRASLVQCMVDLSAWMLVIMPIKQELADGRIRVMNTKIAMETYRLRRADLPHGLPYRPRTMRLDDIIDAALRRHGGQRGLVAYDARVHRTAERRAETIAQRARRLSDVAAASEGEEEDGDRSAAMAEADLLVHCYTRRGGAERLRAARSAVADFTLARRARRALFQALPWPSADSRAARLLIEGGVAGDAAEAYIASGIDADRAVVEAISERWLELLRLWEGAALLAHAPGDCVEDALAACPRASEAAQELVHDGDPEAAETWRRAWDATAAPLHAAAEARNAQLPTFASCPRRVSREALARKASSVYVAKFSTREPPERMADAAEAEAMLEEVVLAQITAHATKVCSGADLRAFPPRQVMQAAKRACSEQPTAVSAYEWTLAEMRRTYPFAGKTCANEECKNTPARACEHRRCRRCCEGCAVH
jgi:hypothetical protein